MMSSCSFLFFKMYRCPCHVMIPSSSTYPLSFLSSPFSTTRSFDPLDALIFSQSHPQGPQKWIPSDENAPLWAKLHFHCLSPPCQDLVVSIVYLVLRGFSLVCAGAWNDTPPVLSSTLLAGNSTFEVFGNTGDFDDPSRSQNLPMSPLGIVAIPLVWELLRASPCHIFRNCVRRPRTLLTYMR